MNGLLVFIEMKQVFFFKQTKNKQPVHMRYHLFLQYGWFLQNFGKDFIRTNMHTTVVNLKTEKIYFMETTEQNKKVFSQLILTHCVYP